jgi:hypothetical protein
MAEVLLSAENDEISDSTSFSAIAFVGFILSLIGIFSLQYIHVVPLAIAGGVLGLVGMLIAKSQRFGIMSKIFATLATFIGVTVTSWGMFTRHIESQYELEQARKISLMYLENLSKGDLKRVMYLIGFQLEAAEGPTGDEETPTRKAVKKFESDPAHVEIRERRNPAKWVFVSLEGELPGSKGHSYKLTFRDEGQTNPPTYWIYPRKNCGKFEKRDIVNWYVDNLEPAKKL